MKPKQILVGARGAGAADGVLGVRRNAFLAKLGYENYPAVPTCKKQPSPHTPQ